MEQLRYSAAVSGLFWRFHPEDSGTGGAVPGSGAVMPSPFAHPPCALARAAAHHLMTQLRQGAEFAEGKMLGVLVVADEGKAESDSALAYLRAFSGQLHNSWVQPGWVPPAFSIEERESFWPQGQAQVEALLAEEERAEHTAERRQELADMRQSREGLDRERRAAKKERSARKKKRAEERVQGGPRSLAELDQESREDGRHWREKRAQIAAALAEIEASETMFQKQQEQRKEQRVALCNDLLGRLHSGYQLVDGAGQPISLAEVFAPDAVPGGAGDCAGAKLLAYANQEGLRPLAMAEFWWGPSPDKSVRHAGQFYPPCHRRCRPLLPALLHPHPVEESPLYATSVATPKAPEIVYEDDALVIVNKPSGMLAVPGKGKLRQDSAFLRLQSERGYADLQTVHRIDRDTSGLLIFAKGKHMKVAMQKLFAERKVEKTYRAWVRGALPVGHEGVIDLPLRVDLEDRPRQLVCEESGKPARTRFRVLRNEQAQMQTCSEVLFWPITGRTHQLRVHASHPRGLGAPILGDRLYGAAVGWGRLYLHAEAVRFVHPGSGKELHLSVEADLSLDP